MDISRAKGRAASGFRPKLHSRAVGRESLNIPKFGRESLNMGRESLDIPKFGRESLDMGRESLCPDFRDPCPDLRDQTMQFSFKSGGGATLKVWT